MNNPSHTTQIRIVAALIVLSYAIATQAQMTTGGDIAGGYLSSNSKTYLDRVKHGEGKASLWLGYKAKNYDWRLSVAGSYKDVDGERVTDDIFSDIADSASYTTVMSSTNEKPFKLTARYDINWWANTHHPSSDTYTLWTAYDYEHQDYESSCMGTTAYMYSKENMFGHFEDKEDVGHQIAAGYRGTTMLGDGRWVLRTNADVSLSRKKEDDGWIKFQLDDGNEDDISAWDAWGWEMHPRYTDYAFNATLHLTDTVFNRRGSRLLLGGGIRFKGDGERFTHDEETDQDDIDLRVDTVFSAQRATGFRYFVEPFLSGKWETGDGTWVIDAEYGLRLYHTNTTDKTGHAVLLYDFIDPQHPLNGNSVSHFTPLVTGRAQLTHKLSRHHSLSLTNSLSNRLPSNRETVLCFVQLREYNKVALGNPNLKPEVKVQVSLAHTFKSGPFSATTDVSFERINNEMESYFYGCWIGGHKEIAQMTLNVADVTNYKLSETLAWNNKWLKASATLWGRRAHYSGIGGAFSGCVDNSNDWGWNVDAKATLGRGWLITTNFQYMGSYETMTSERNPTWQSAAASIEKRIRHVTIYLSGNSLIDPVISFSKNDMNGNMIYYNESRRSNRIVMLGCRWVL